MTNPSRRTPVLDARLSAAMALAGSCKVFADIGADHGRLSAVMLLADPQRRALIADISDLALSKARRRISGLHLQDRAVFAVADGLSALEALSPTPVDVAFILGMGGDTISGILRRGAGWLRGASVVVSPQTEIPLVRQALVDIGYRIRNEVVANENRRDYLLLLATPARQGEPSYSDEELWLGPVLLRTLPPSARPVLERRRRLLGQGVAAMEKADLDKDLQRLTQARRELAAVENALKRMDEKEDCL